MREGQSVKRSGRMACYLGVEIEMDYYCKLKALNQIGFLGSLEAKKGYEFHFDLFFQSKISDRKFLLDKGNLVLFSQNGLISVGNLENITNKYKKLSFRKFTDQVAQSI